jgi:hypothetical protein
MGKKQKKRPPARHDLLKSAAGLIASLGMPEIEAIGHGVSSFGPPDIDVPDSGGPQVTATWGFINWQLKEWVRDTPGRLAVMFSDAKDAYRVSLEIRLETGQHRWTPEHFTEAAVLCTILSYTEKTDAAAQEFAKRIPECLDLNGSPLVVTEVHLRGVK